MDAQKGSLTRSAALLLPALAGLVASAILLVDYSRVAPVFCDGVSGCAQLKQTVYASFLGVPTPAYGLAAFLAIGILGVQRGPRVRVALLAVASAAALVAVLLLSVQARAGVWCKYCVIADVSSCLVFGVALWRQLAAWDPPLARLPRIALVSTLAPALVVPLGIGALRKPTLPDVIARELARTPKGEVTVIDFADFECPFCRMTHAELVPILAEHPNRIRVVRKNVPLTRIHPHALEAARAACCGEQLGKGEAMADKLFAAPVEELTSDGCARLAVSLGLDEEAFRKCTHDPATDARIQADQDAFKASQGHGLPMLWIDEQVIEGYRPGDELKKSLERELERRG